MIKSTLAKPSGPMSRDEARNITDRIRNGMDSLSALLLEARDRNAFKALGYATWDAYVSKEFSISIRRSYQLIDQETVNRAIAAAAGENVNHGTQISERAARDIKADLPAVTAEIRSRVEQGEAPDKAATAAVKAAREKVKADKATEQAEFDRQRDEARAAFSPEVQASQAAKAEAIAARKDKPAESGLTDAERIAELEESVRILEAENAALKIENQKYAEMKAEFDKGGFAEVIAGKDEVISAQASRVERESQEKVANLRSMEFWKKKAIEGGYSRDTVIDLETGEIING